VSVRPMFLCKNPFRTPTITIEGGSNLCTKWFVPFEMRYIAYKAQWMSLALDGVYLDMFDPSDLRYASSVWICESVSVFKLQSYCLKFTYT